MTISSVGKSPIEGEARPRPVEIPGTAKVEVEPKERSAPAVVTVRPKDRAPLDAGVAAPVSVPPSDPETGAPTPQRSEYLVEMHSGELEEIIGYAPNWLIRWGISAILFTLLTLVAISWFVEYPELVRGDITVTTPKPPVRLVALQKGELEGLFVKDGSLVAQGEVLALLKNAADLDAIQALSRRLETLEVDLSRGRLSAEDYMPASDGFVDPRLGRIQREHSAFLKSLSDFLVFQEDDYYGRKVRALESQIAKHHELRSSIESQLDLTNQQLDLAERQKRRHLELADEGLLSTMDQEKIEAEYLEMRTTLEGDVRDLASSNVLLVEYQSSLLDLRYKNREDQRRLHLELRGRINDLRSAISLWKQDFLFTAPVSGKVSFLRVLDENHFVAAGEAVLAVVPEGAPAYVQMRLSQDGAGRVKIGQSAILRFAGYPASQFGTVHGRVESISLVPSRKAIADDPTYLVSMSLPDGLVTSYQQQLDFRQEMGGTAEIVTEDLRLLERLFFRLRDILR
ncbi:MAG: HlyD family efflux transporter periplasmic adaptor subunit [Acidobacteriota bacterium]